MAVNRLDISCSYEQPREVGELWPLHPKLMTRLMLTKQRYTTVDKYRDASQVTLASWILLAIAVALDQLVETDVPALESNR